jgi:hypothetical protein
MSTKKRLRQALRQMHAGWSFVDAGLASIAGRVVDDGKVVIGDRQPHGTAFRVIERTLLPFYAGMHVVS